MSLYTAMPKNISATNKLPGMIPYSERSSDIAKTTNSAVFGNSMRGQFIKVLYNISMIDDLKLSYYAGFTDGEGCISIYKPASPSFGFSFNQVQISNTDLAILTELKNDFGGHISKMKRRKENHRQAYTWFIGNKQAEYFVKAIFPYLRQKKSQAAVFLAFRDTVNERGHHRRTNEEDEGVLSTAIKEIARLKKL